MGTNLSGRLSSLTTDTRCSILTRDWQLKKQSPFRVSIKATHGFNVNFLYKTDKSDRKTKY